MIAMATYKGFTASEIKKTEAKRNPIPNNHPLRPSRYSAMKNAVKTSNEPTSGIAKTTTAGIPTMARVVRSDFLFFKLNSGPET